MSNQFKKNMKKLLRLNVMERHNIDPYFMKGVDDILSSNIPDS